MRATSFYWSCFCPCLLEDFLVKEVLVIQLKSKSDIVTVYYKPSSAFPSFSGYKLKICIWLLHDVSDLISHSSLSSSPISSYPSLTPKASCFRGFVLILPFRWNVLSPYVHSSLSSPRYHFSESFLEIPLKITLPSLMFRADTPFLDLLILY